MPATTMICFANSRKLGGRCVAGLAWDGEKYSIWIRPVTAYGHGELKVERLYGDDSDAQPLDVIEMEYGGRRPSGCHVEDVLVNSNKVWIKRGSVTYQDALRYASAPDPPLWVDGGHTVNGFNDCIDEVTASTLRSSLRLVVPVTLTIRSTEEWERRRVRGDFSLGTTSYTLSVTDTRIEREFASQAIGATRVIEKPILCISIGEVFESQKACYKLIAGVMEA